jgi:hypothetical protein
LIQVIPYKRSGFDLKDYESRDMDDKEKLYYSKSRSAERTRQNGFYRWLTQQNKKKWKEEGVIDE